MSGGVEWEQGAAVSRMVQALLTNDHEMMALAMSDYAAALGTRTTSVLSGIVTTVLLELQQTRMDRQADARNIDHKLDLILLANEALSDRLTLVEIATLAHTIGAEERQQIVDLVRTIPDLKVRIERLEADRGA